ncbi:hypothetical protein [Wenxinia saemankumensis]|uniref:Uncharacterized protein n=1 Tax=Wenxinia saemankumensis TaxID=1447782 RepID=A0A1M6E5J6_9RHOB|nr:hypothetical protein [Wenxinia saemankumensis]SHI80762.1 hypothetical protein SAMN05444417_1817 [Wenxinia saemankumensis]
MTAPPSPADLQDRIRLHEGLQLVEIDLAGLVIADGAGANRFYDAVERRIDESGEPLWFFLIHTGAYRVDPAAWFAFTHRGQAVQEAHSMGTVRVDDSPEGLRQIERDRARGQADPRLFATRDAALAALSALPSRRRRRIEHAPSFAPGDIAARLTFRPRAEVLELDLSGLDIAHGRDAHAVFDAIETAIRPTGRRWYLLTDYTGTRIQSAAWLAWSLREDALAARHLLGAVRHAPGSETERDLRLRAEGRGHRPNIRNTRGEAMARIDELRAERAATLAVPGGGA